MAKEVINEERRAFLGTSAFVVVGAVMGGSPSATPTGASDRAGSVKMPAVIGYPNAKGVTIERITYPARNLGTTIVANLLKPAGLTATGRYAAVVVTHPFGGVKEQTAGLYSSAPRRARLHRARLRCLIPGRERRRASADGGAGATAR